jgi:hypothetical protein
MHPIKHPSVPVVHLPVDAVADDLRMLIDAIISDRCRLVLEGGRIEVVPGPAGRRRDKGDRR